MRSYSDACGITRALDVVGERWAMPVVRELIFGPRRYSDLAAALPNVSTNILGARLKELTAAGVTIKRRMAAPAAATVYELTPWGAALEPALIALGRWAAHTPTDLEHQSFSASSFALSLKTTFDPDAAAQVNLALRLVMGSDVFDAQITDADFTIRRADMTDVNEFADLGSGAVTRVEAEPKTMAALVYQRLDPFEDFHSGEVRIGGPSESWQTFTRCFTLPEPPMKGSP
ncbi:winged helix-turn-helix transcriptional regulator [Garicola koreensis]|uniref:DNA-binding HxlR family transcriptional regulator n=1 Tax=Garicola koreensis TaxID=1262554 RepID=A0A7W5XK35_9MICC|nr:helix-turn-helix domain-containing protein [Garicola koreensis]MBB3667082.1 DNA-binding HxlR family transcriptional regulator [Garicola koreensis]